MIDDLLRGYPRTRPPLPDAHRRVYEREYTLNRDGDAPIEDLAKKLEGWMHRRVAAHPGSPVLELGAGTLNHLPYERSVQDYDIAEPFSLLYGERPGLSSVRRVYDSVNDIPDTARYRRIVSVAVLEHMTDLPAELARAGLLLDDQGLFQAGIPSEGGLLWWLAWRCSTGLSYFLRNRLDYGVLMRHEHVNTAPEIIALARYFFRDVTVTRFPLPAHHLSLYASIEARNPDLTRCRALLAERQS